MKDVIDRALLVMLFLSIGAMILVLTWLTWPYDVIQHQLDPLPLESTALHSGDSIVYHAVYTKTTDAVGIASIQLVNHVIWFYPSVAYAGPLGQYDVWGRSFSVPPNMPPGKGYYLQFAIEYRVNPIRTIVERYRTEEFEVIDDQQNSCDP